MLPQTLPGTGIAMVAGSCYLGNILASLVIGGIYYICENLQSALTIDALLLSGIALLSFSTPAWTSILSGVCVCVRALLRVNYFLITRIYFFVFFFFY